MAGKLVLLWQTRALSFLMSNLYASLPRPQIQESSCERQGHICTFLGLQFMLEKTDQQSCDSSETLRLFVSSEIPDVQLHQLMLVQWMLKKMPNKANLMSQLTATGLELMNSQLEATSSVGET